MVRPLLKQGFDSKHGVSLTAIHETHTLGAWVLELGKVKEEVECQVQPHKCKEKQDVIELILDSCIESCNILGVFDAIEERHGRDQIDE